MCFDFLFVACCTADATNIVCVVFFCWNVDVLIAIIVFINSNLGCKMHFSTLLFCATFPSEYVVDYQMTDCLEDFESS